MKIVYPPVRLFICCVLFSSLCSLGLSSDAVVVYSEDFEGGVVPVGWELDAGLNSRARVITADGNKLLMLDSVRDSVVSVPSIIRYPLKVSGVDHLSIQFSAFLGNDKSPSVDSGFDGLQVYVGEDTGGYNALASVWDSNTMPSPEGKKTLISSLHIDSIFDDFDPHEEYTVWLKFMQAGNAPYPIRGIGYDDITIYGRVYEGISIEGPEHFIEGDGNVQVTVGLFPVPETDVVIVTNLLGISDPVESVYPANTNFITISVPYPDNEVSNGLNEPYFQVEVPGFYTESKKIKIYDDEAVTLVLYGPSEVSEGTGYLDGEFYLEVFGIGDDLNFHFELETDPYLSLSEDEFDYYSWRNGYMPLNFYTHDDDHVAGDYYVNFKIVSGTDVSNTLRVLVRNSNEYDPDFNITKMYEGQYYMGNLKEGESRNTYIELGANPLETVTFTLSAEPLGQITITETVEITPDSDMSSLIEIQVLDDELSNGPRYVKITGTPDVEGIPEVVGYILIEDDERNHFTVFWDEIPMLGERLISCFVRSVGSDGKLGISGGEIAEVFRVSPEGVEISHYGASLEVPFAANVTYDPSLSGSYFKVVAEGGDEGRSLFKIHGSVPLPDLDPVDITYSDVTDLLYLAVGNLAGSSYKNSIVSVDPKTGEITDSLSLPGTPVHMKKSPGQDKFYIFYASSTLVQELNPGNLTLTDAFDLYSPEAGLENAVFSAKEVVVVSGTKDSFVVSQETAGKTKRFVYLYENGVVVSSYPDLVTADFLGTTSGDYLFSTNRSSDKIGNYSRFSVSDSEIKLLSHENNSFNEPGSSYTVGSDHLVSNWGELYRMDDFSPVAHFSYPYEISNHSVSVDPCVVLDEAHDRFFVAVNRFVAYYSLDSRQMVRLHSFQDLDSGITELNVYGNYLVVTTSKGRSYLLDDYLMLPRGDEVDLAVEMTSEETEGVYNPFAEYSFTLSNESANDCRDPMLAIEFEGSFKVHSFEGDDLSWIQESDLRCFIKPPAIEAGGEVSFKLKGTFRDTANMALKAVVLSEQPEANQGNNSLMVRNWPMNDVQIDESYIMGLMIDDVVWSERLNLLLASVSDYRQTYNNIPDDLGLSSSLIAIDPLAGELVWSYFLGGGNIELELSQDGKHVFALNQGLGNISKINLDTQDLEYSFVLYENWINSRSYNPVYGMIPGDPVMDDILILMGGAYLYFEKGEFVSSLSSNNLDDKVLLKGDQKIDEFYMIDTLVDVALVELSKQGDSVAEARRSGSIIMEQVNAVQVGDLFVNIEGQILSRANLEHTATLSFDAIDSINNELDEFKDIISEEDKKRIYLLKDNWLFSYHTDEFKFVRGVEMEGLSDDTQKMLRWGADGFAFLEDGILTLARSTIVPGGESLDTQFFYAALPGKIESFPFDMTGSLFSSEPVDRLILNGRNITVEPNTNEWIYTVDYLNPANETLSAILHYSDKNKDDLEIIIPIQIRIPGDGDNDGIQDYWERNHSVGNADLSTDTDGDGLSLRAEYFFDLSPENQDYPYEIRPDYSMPGYVSSTFTFKRLIGQHSRLVWEKSEDLISWASESVEVSIEEITPMSGSNTHEWVTYCVRMNELDGQTFFLRILMRD